MTTEMSDEALTAENYSKAMNSVGQHLLSALHEAVGQLPPAFRTRQVVSQALAAFLMNVIHKQFPGNHEACQHMLDEITRLVKTQLGNVPSQ